MNDIASFFAQSGEGGQPRTLRLKIIRPVFESIIIHEDATLYLPDAPLKSSSTVFNLFRFLQQEAKECLFALHVNSKNKLLCVELVSVGSLNASIVHPREVFKSALLSNAASMILVHNHPSGDPAPSRGDHDITKRLKEGAELLGIRLLDHIIIGDNYYSFADAGSL
jgi:DNA repair protein RadC